MTDRSLRFRQEEASLSQLSSNWLKPLLSVLVALFSITLRLSICSTNSLPWIGFSLMTAEMTHVEVCPFLSLNLMTSLLNALTLLSVWKSCCHTQKQKLCESSKNSWFCLVTWFIFISWQTKLPLTSKKWTQRCSYFRLDHKNISW